MYVKSLCPKSLKYCIIMYKIIKIMTPASLRDYLLILLAISDEFIGIN